jgi:galactokinase
MQAAARIALEGDEPLLAGTVLTASTELPVGAGVSSSAALTLAVVAAVRALRDGHAIGTWAACELAHQAETVELGSGAGWMDFLACGQGGVNHVHAGGVQPYAQLIAPSLEVPVILVDTLARRTTTEVLASKRQRFRDGHPDMAAYVHEAPLLVDALAAALRRRPVDYREVGALLTSGQNLLRDRVHCSTELIDLCVDRITAAGAYGAKLSGSGHGGVLFALAPTNAVSSILGALQELPVHAIALPRCEPSGLISGLSAPAMAGGSPQTG